MLNSHSVGNKIAAARKKIQLSQSELGQKVSISPQAVGKWERGESYPDIATLNRLAEIFGVDLNYFSDNFQPGEQTIPIQPIVEKQEARPGKQMDWNWDMSQGNWSDADFSGLKNLKEKFSNSNIRNCKFNNADLSGLMLGSNNIEICDFSNANLRDSKIQSSNILNDKFQYCSLIDAKILKTNIEKCDFSGADFSGTEIKESNLERNDLQDVNWKYTSFQRSNLSNLVFSGQMENCHFEHCGFYSVRFENTTILNTFFKYNDRFKKVQFVNCQVDSITFAFLKNNQANLEGVTIINQ